MGIVNLTIHKNTLHKRKAKEFRAFAINNFKRAINKPEVTNFAYVAWGDGTFHTGYSLDKNTEAIVMPEIAKSALMERIIRDF